MKDGRGIFLAWLGGKKLHNSAPMTDNLTYNLNEYNQNTIPPPYRCKFCKKVFMVVLKLAEYFVMVSGSMNCFTGPVNE
jgi:hypothetical protein